MIAGEFKDDVPNPGEWTLPTIVNKLMVPSGRYSGGTIRKYRQYAKHLSRFVGRELKAREVTAEILKKFSAEFGIDHTPQVTRATVAGICSIVHYADANLLSEFSKGRPLRIGGLMQFFEDVFLVENCRGKKPSYIQAYHRSMERFITFCRRDPDVQEITTQTLREYRKWFLMSNRGAPGTAYDDAVRIRRVLLAAGKKLIKRRPRKERKVADLPVELGEFATQVYLIERQLSDRHASLVLTVVKQLREWRRRPISFEELPELLSKYVAYIEKRYASITVKRRRGIVISIWNLAADHGLCDYPIARQIRDVKVERPTPTAWTLEDVATLVEACASYRGECYRNGIDRGLFWEAFIRLGYDTALRRGDILSLTKDQLENVDGKWIFRLVQHKTGDGIVVPVSEKTVKAINALFPPEREIIFDWPYTKPATFYNHWYDLVNAAGLTVDRRNGPQKLRRTSATHIEAIRPGSAMAHLGHRTAGLAYKHYVDREKAFGVKPLPPSFD